MILMISFHKSYISIQHANPVLLRWSLLKIERDDHLFAVDLATRAGQLLVDQRKSPPNNDFSKLGDAGDQRSHEFLMESLSEFRPEDGVLSEEGTAHPVHPDRSEVQRVWIIDPVDGTREYSDPPRTDWAVHVALAIDGEPVVGAVALPALDLTLSTADKPTSKFHDLVPKSPRIVISRSRPPSESELVCQALAGEMIEMGSAGAKAMAVVRGEADIYLHSGGQYEWDNCAPAAVALSAGLHVSRLDGSSLSYNNLDPWLPDLLICHPALSEPVLNILHEAKEI